MELFSVAAVDPAAGARALLDSRGDRPVTWQVPSLADEESRFAALEFFAAACTLFGGALLIALAVPRTLSGRN